MRRMCYLTIKEMAKMTENAFIVTQRYFPANIGYLSNFYHLLCLPSLFVYLVWSYIIIGKTRKLFLSSFQYLDT